MMTGPVPGMLEKLLTGEVGLLYALRRELGNHLCLGGDRGMVGAGHPARVLALHSRTAYEDVLDGLVEHMSHMQHTGHIGGRDDYGVGFP